MPFSMCFCCGSFSINFQLISCFFVSQVVQLGLRTCLTEPEERISGRGGGDEEGNSSATENANANASFSTRASGAAASSSSSFSHHLHRGGPKSTTAGLSSPTSSTGGMMSMVRTGSSSSKLSNSNNNGCYLGPGGVIGGVGGGGGSEEALPLGTASVLWELECCAAQTRVTLMNLNEGRPNHFGVFRAGVYVAEIRMLEEKVCFYEQLYLETGDARLCDTAV